MALSEQQLFGRPPSIFPDLPGLGPFGGEGLPPAAGNVQVGEEVPVPMPRGGTVEGGEEEKVTAWKSFLMEMKQDPSLNQFLLTLGTNLLQPLARGQTRLGHFGAAVAAANAARQQAKAQFGQAALADAELRLKERELAGREAKDKAYSDYLKQLGEAQGVRAEAAKTTAAARLFAKKSPDAKLDDDLFKYFTDQALAGATEGIAVGQTPDPQVLQNARLVAQMRYNQAVAVDPAKLKMPLAWSKATLTKFVDQALAATDDEVPAIRQRIATHYPDGAEEAFVVEFNRRLREKAAPAAAPGPEAIPKPTPGETAEPIPKPTQPPKVQPVLRTYVAPGSSKTTPSYATMPRSDLVERIKEIRAKLEGLVDPDTRKRLESELRPLEDAFKKRYGGMSGI